MSAKSALYKSTIDAFSNNELPVAFGTARNYFTKQKAQGFTAFPKEPLIFQKPFSR